MKKILLFIALLAVVGVGAAAAGYYFYLSPKARASYTSEAALPSVPDAEYTAAMKLTDMGSFKSIITGVSSLVSDFQPILDGGTASNIRSLLDSLNALLDTVTEMSVLVTPGQLSPAVYVSLLVDGAAFSRIMAEMPNEFLAVEKWDSGIKGSEGWSIKNANGFALYVLKRDGAENSQVLAAGAEEAVSAMISAADDKSRRFSPERMTSGVNFFQLRLKNGFTYGMLSEILTEYLGPEAFNPVNPIFRKNSDRVIFTVYEYSETKDGNVITIDSYSDNIEKNPELAASHPKSAVAPQLMGDGELVYFMAFDAGLILSSLCPGAEDPAQEVFGLLGAAPLLTGDLKTILSSTRISIACVAKDKKLNTAYALIETDASESLSKLYSMVGFLGLPSTELQGWDSAVSASIPGIGLLDKNVILAHRKGAFMAGIGTAADFAKSPAVQDEYKEFMSQDNIMSVVVSSKLYDMVPNMIQDIAAVTPNKISASGEASIAAMEAIRDSFEFIGARLSASGRSHGKYISTEGGNLIEAIFEVFSRTAQQMTAPATGL